MTAQIAIMNKNAVALATDSAVTTQHPQGVKIHNTANKLFMLSKYQPVGVMIYENVDFMGYPWETLIKVYRRHLGARTFGTLKEYADHFFQFLRERQNLFSPDQQEQWFRMNVGQYVGALNLEFVSRVKQYFDERGQELDDAGRDELLERFLVEKERLPGFTAIVDPYVEQASKDHFIANATPIIIEIISDVFQRVPIAPFLERLQELTLRRFMYDSAVAYTGLVFAGFGDDEFLPVVESYWIDGIFAGLLRSVKYPNRSGNMNADSGVRIFPFAQSDTVFRFLQGIDPTFNREAEKHIDTMVDEILGEVLATIHPLVGEDAAQTAHLNLANAASASRQRLTVKIDTLKQEKFVSPVIDVISTLPKEDLAAIAESLVNLTSFQRKILREAETVGGPIDVAVISKGDGFIWIKRKHYFEKSLNPAFFANYYRGDGING